MNMSFSATTPDLLAVGTPTWIGLPVDLDWFCRCLLGIGGSDVSETRDPPDQDLAHRPTRGHDLRIGQPVSDLAAVSHRLDDADSAESGQVL